MATRMGRAAAIALAAGAGLAGARPAAAQDSATVVASKRYEAGSVRRALLGEDYRDLWQTPTRVPVLDLRRFGGGLTPTERGGGNQTKSLRFRGGDGREYSFRSVDKEVTPALPKDIQNTAVDWLIQDQVSSLHPDANPIAIQLQLALGLLGAQPRLYAMPDDPALGEFRHDFAGMLGVVEERPGNGKHGPAFAGADDVADTEDMWKDVEQDARHRVDSRDYLTGRLFDLWIADWDRHEDQYKWARFDRGGEHVWRAIGRDRDYAFVRYDGALLPVARSKEPKLVTFERTYPKSLIGLLENPQRLDRRILSDLPRPVWDSVVTVMQARLSDAVIARAVRSMPPEWYARSGAELESRLRARRDELPEAAERFYRIAALDPEIHATDDRDVADVVRNGDGSADVRLYASHDGEAEARPYYQRRFLPGETDEVRIFLHGGDDRLTVRGGGGIGVIAVGGGGDDRLEDRSTGTTAFDDDQGHNLFVRGAHTAVDERPYEERVVERGKLQAQPRDWGSKTSFLAPLVQYRSGVGLVVGAGPSITRYGFRTEPSKLRTSLKGVYAPKYGRFGVELTADRHWPNSQRSATLLARATDLELTRFHGYGNESPGGGEWRYRVFNRELLLFPTLSLPVAPGTFFAFGPNVRRNDARELSTSAAGILRPRGVDAFTTAGAHGDLLFDNVPDSVSNPRRGLRAQVGGTGNPLATGGDVGPYGDAHAQAAAYLSIPGMAGPTLALRAGGQKVWGDFPFQDAAYIGGSGTLRGFHGQRYAGDAAAWGGAELRTFLTRATLLVHGDLGAFALADAGRVFVHGDSPGGWHTALGGGLSFTFLDGRNTVSAAYARGDKGSLYFKFGMPY
ncbi:MAG TPA: BamA/TamA family outer membrane protein [Longimicrobiaceae bacterium]|nr:BamA/TamA family outer membrane protein [Longimicrobiaceae bacterium]